MNKHIMICLIMMIIMIIIMYDYWFICITREVVRSFYTIGFRQFTKQWWTNWMDLSCYVIALTDYEHKFAW